MDNKKIVVVGGGPSGMMAAIRASQLNKDVTLLEKNPSLGNKLLLSGKGRCNLTNACDLDAFIARFFGNGQFLRDAFAKFFNQDLMRFFEERGLKLKIERQERVFPVTDRSSSVLDILKKELIKNKVKVIYGAKVKDILLDKTNVRGILLESGQTLSADKVILATGGVSFSFTGSTGDGINMARKFGHRVVTLRPGLVPLVIKEHYPKMLEGLTLKNIRLKIINSKREADSEIGELLFTAFGISGPLVFSLSAKIGAMYEEDKNTYVEIDLKPALSKEQLDSRLLREFKLNSKKSLKNTFKTLLPMSLIEVFLHCLKIDSGKIVSYVTQGERQRMISLLKGFRLSIKSLRPIEDGMVTRGGVSLKDINPRTMESRLVRGLYFAGEMIDVDADTGGFNLQAAFSTGYLAGESAALS